MSPPTSRAGSERGAWAAVMAATDWFSGIGIILLMIPTVLEVSHRKLLGPSLPGMVEYSEVWLVIVVHLAMAVALRHGAHIQTPILTSRLRPRTATFVRLAGQVLMWVAIAVMVWGSAGIAIESTVEGEYRFGLIEVPIWPAKLAVPVGLTLLLIELSRQMLRGIASLRTMQGPHVA